MPDIDEMNIKYRQEVDSLSDDIDAELSNKVAQLTEDARSKGNQIHFTEEYLTQSRRVIQWDKQYEVYSRYSDRIRDANMKCIDKRSTIIKELFELR